MATIIEEILSKIPHDAKISCTKYEGANIVLYTKSKQFFKYGGDIIYKLVEDFKKRIELRADPSIRVSEEKTLSTIKKIIPKEAEISKIGMISTRGLVIIEARKPGVAIGKNGEKLKEIKNETLWIPVIQRKPEIRSALIQNIRNVLYEDSAERKKFLDDVGKRIYEVTKSSAKTKWAKISYLGGARQVGRSCLFLQTPESKILLDCGVDIASTSHSFPHLEAPEFNIQDLDAVIVSHAHLDHCGLVPLLFKYGYRGPVYCTAPTRDIMALLQLDYIQVSHGQGGDAIYATNDIKEMIKHTIVLELGEVTDISPDVRVTLYNAGHIIGSSLVHLHIGEGWHNLLYTGDFKTKATNLLNPAHTKFPRVETLLIESTYGCKDDEMPPRKTSEKELTDLVEKTIKKKGKVLIPVLGVGRAQEVMLVLKDYFEKKKLKIPIYVEGMLWDVNAIACIYPRFLSKDVKEKVFYKDDNPFLADTFKEVAGGKERRQVIDGGPCVVLATSGMLTGGPSVEYLREFAANKNNQLIFVSYQGAGSLGRKIQSGLKELTFNGNQTIPLNMKINTIPGLSGHADRKELIEYVKKIDPSPRRIIINHGEKSKCLDLASSLHKAFKVETTVPRNMESFRLR
ncbi:MAG: beta-CASP ribonuclease aCPSF1 [Candidatus Woesearchaeota archaeon]|nr:MAG: beta-CASP ribonuclease aCPSF1 [Candidatus Woesearchaeota archaeon]